MLASNRDGSVIEVSTISPSQVGLGALIKLLAAITR